MLQEYIQQNRISITKEKTQEILQVLGNEPDNHYEWSEQDLYEHLRKLIKKTVQLFVHIPPRPHKLNIVNTP